MDIHFLDVQLSCFPVPAIQQCRCTGWKGTPLYGGILYLVYTGRILYLASDAAVAVPEDMLHYGVSKTALVAAARGYAKVAAGSGVTVNSVIAGPTRTDGAVRFIREKFGPDVPWEDAQATFMATERSASLIKRLIDPAEVANMIVYLSSPQASATTGGAVRVDGGYVDSIFP